MKIFSPFRCDAAPGFHPTQSVRVADKRANFARLAVVEFEYQTFIYRKCLSFPREHLFHSFSMQDP